MPEGERGDVDGFEPGMPGESEDDVLRRYLCVHFPHKISEIMLDYLGHRQIANVLTQIIGPNVKCMQSMLFIKAAGKPGQAWHQDEFSIPTRDRTLTGGWIALDDATVENGCLWVIPGSHKRGIIWPQHDHVDPQFDCAGEAYGFPYRDEDSIPVEVKAGAIVFLQRLSVAPLVPQPGAERLPAGSGKPLHERGVSAALAESKGKRAHGSCRLPGYRDDYRRGSIPLEGVRRAGGAAGAAHA